MQPGSDSQIDYERLVNDAMRDAMRSVLRRVLIEVAKSGLPGDHHFYISFNTNAPGVSLSKRLLEKYPEEMTIVLQHRFWDLAVHADRFEVKLQFNSIPEKLVVPFEAIRVFVDPSVRFGHQFDDGEGGDATDAILNAGNAPRSPRHGTAARGGTGAVALRPGTDKRRPATRKRVDKDVDLVDATEGATDLPAVSSEMPPKQTSAAVPPVPPAASPAASDDSAGKVVSLDKFRKK